MPDINDELLALIGQAPQRSEPQTVGLPDLQMEMLLSASARSELAAVLQPGAELSVGFDVFLAPTEPTPRVAQDTRLEDIWDRPEDRPEDGERGPIEGADANLEALFMGGREAQEAATAQGYSYGGVSFTPPGPGGRMAMYDAGAGLEVSFDSLDSWEGGGGGGHAPNPAVRWTVGRENPRPAAPPMQQYRQGQGTSDGVVVSTRQGGQFVAQERPRPAPLSRETFRTPAATAPQTARAEAAPAPAPAPMRNAPTLYDHILSDD